MGLAYHFLIYDKIFNNVYLLVIQVPLSQISVRVLSEQSWSLDTGMDIRM